MGLHHGTLNTAESISRIDAQSVNEIDVKTIDSIAGDLPRHFYKDGY